MQLDTPSASFGSALVVSVYWKCRRLAKDWLSYISLKRSNIRLHKYQEWLDGLDVDSLSPAEYAEIHNEKFEVIDLLRKGKDIDGIIKRRLKRIRAKGR